jgi:quercetin dioxygenase-like cupin family protein
MKKALITLLVASVPAVALAQDAVRTDPTHYKVVLDNASVRILHITYAAGDKSQKHSHPDAIVIPLSTSKVTFTMADGMSQVSDLANEAAQYTPAGTHTVTAATKVDALLVEFKGAAGKAALPASRAGMTLKVLAEGAHGTAYRSTASATFAEPAGSKHDFDQVVIALGASPLSLSVAGQPTKSTWTRGDVAFIGRGVAHESKNTGGKPADMIIVAIK